MLTIKPERVLGNLRALAEIGKYKTGVHRPSLTPEHMRSIEWLSAEVRSIGQEPVVDGIGNVLAKSSATGRKLIAGSHLESQNHAGWLDGPLGVIFALEAARTLKEAGVTDVGIDVAVWCDEEGHFGNFLGSRSFIGEVTEAEIDAAKDRTNGRSMREALAACGLSGRPRLVIESERYAGYLEAHIEQGDWLESTGLKIGVVTSIVGLWQYRIVFEGVQNHAGTTRMAIRKDAGVAAASLVCEIERRFPGVAGERTVWTTGNITLKPGAPSIIPGHAEMLFQFRDADPERLIVLERELTAIVADANTAGPCKVELTNLRKSIPARMDERFQAAFEGAAERVAPDGHTRMPSGAGHDAQVLARRIPAGMLFVPSIGGISHHWTENTSDEDIVRGARVFAEAAAAILAS